MKKNDFIVIALCIFAAMSGFLLRTAERKQGTPIVVITAGGKEYGTFELNKDRVIDINGSNTLVIKDGSAAMTKADCPDRLCTYQKPISKDGESIICLPNRITVTVESSDTPLADSVAN